MNNKNICILSMQKVSNYGSVLQSYSLKKILEELGNNVSFIDIEKIDEDNALLDKTNSFDNEYTSKSGLASKLEKIDRHFFNRVKLKFKTKAFCKEMDKFRDNVLNIKDEDNNRHYDYCVIGSDEVFNCMQECSWGFTTQLFGNVRQADKVLTYAASCGATKLEDVPNKAKEKIKESLNKLIGISVRDLNTYDFVYGLTNKEPIINLDPVVIGNFDLEMKKARQIELPKKYCVLYAYSNRFHDKEDIRKIKEFCNNHNLELVTLGGTQYWVKKHIVCEPFEMLNVFKNADMIITDTFHGTIFSAKYSNKFAVVIRESNRNKLYDLVNRLDIKEHLINSVDDLEDNYKIIKDQDKIDNIIKQERVKSINYLKGCVK